MIGVKPFAKKLVAYIEKTADAFEETSKRSKEAKHIEAAIEDMTIARTLRVMARIISHVAEIDNGGK